MYDSSSMDVLKTSEKLVHEELLMAARNLAVETDDIVQICVHVVSDDVELTEVVRVAWEDQIMHLDNLKRESMIRY